MVLYKLKLSKLSCILPIFAVVAEYVEATASNVDYLPPARITLQPAQFNVSSPAEPPSGHAEVAP